MCNTLHEPDTNLRPAFNKYIEGRAYLITKQVHAAGAMAADIRLVASEITGRRRYETTAEMRLREAEVALSLLLDDIRAARSHIAAQPAPAPIRFLEAAE